MRPILRQAQDEEVWVGANLSFFLMLSLSKHEEAPYFNPISVRKTGVRLATQ